jgi:hypothetical protein
MLNLNAPGFTPQDYAVMGYNFASVHYAVLYFSCLSYSLQDSSSLRWDITLLHCTTQWLYSTVL